ncbi:MAG: DsrE family protein [Planctomycetota bacterium]|nr:DsrE family protein [Planctomycetota bacterium]
MTTVVIIPSDGMGRGDDALGQKILASFLGKAGALEGLAAVCLYNGGVKLLVEGSPALQGLAALEARGVDVVACGTCVDHFGLRERVRVGVVGTMDDIVSRLDRAAKVVTL